ncbi:hypothetical protein [Aeromicrobium sp. IC_218]|uniref:hypothetical protein n=1 Tax=Aeromicrobium sp. IC_218 TaxID=2545468 RepID=UPI0013F45099|nr:hypothetical protein [Aeromicrobium sp. IC_218]
MRRTAALLLVLVLAGCGLGDEPDEARAGLPDGVTVSLDQARSDMATRRVLARVQNDGSEPLVVRELQVRLPRWGVPGRYEGPATVPPGGALNLAVEAPTAACGDGVDARVRLVLDGGAGTVDGGATDRFGAIARLLDRDCADALLRVDAGAPRLEGREIVLPLMFRTTGEDVTVGSVAGTVLLDLAPGEDGRLDRRLAAGDRWSRDVRLAPARCDAHVVAEDKVGTLLPLQVTTRHGAVTTFLRPAPAVKGGLLDSVVRLCGIGQGDDPLLDD